MVSFLAKIGNNNVGLFRNGNNLDIGYGSTHNDHLMTMIAVSWHA